MVKKLINAGLLSHSLNTFKRSGIELKKPTLAVIRNFSRKVKEDLKESNELISERNVLEKLAKSLAESGFEYGNKDSFFDQIDARKTDCQGNCFLYTVAIDQLDSSQLEKNKYTLATFFNPNNFASHVAISYSSNPEIWETTKPGFINPIEIYNFGYTKKFSYSWNESSSIPEAIVVAHLNCIDDAQGLFSFIDSLVLGDQKYPSVSFYLRHKLKAIDKLFAAGLIGGAEYFFKAETIFNKLISADVNDDIKLQLHKVKLLYQKSDYFSYDNKISATALKDAIGLLLDLTKKNISNEDQQLVLFLLGHGYLNLFLANHDFNNKKKAIPFFTKASEIKLPSIELRERAIENIVFLKT